MYSGSCRSAVAFTYGAFTLSGWLSQNHSVNYAVACAVRTPWCTHHGLGSAGFARRYFRHRCFFLFLRLLRCFSSPGSLPYVMDWRTDDRGLLCRVSPFRNLRVKGHVLLTAAYHVFHRLLVPRHPPCALLRLTRSDFGIRNLTGYSSVLFPGHMHILLSRSSVTRMHSVACSGRVLLLLRNFSEPYVSEQLHFFLFPSA